MNGDINNSRCESDMNHFEKAAMAVNEYVKKFGTEEIFDKQKFADVVHQMFPEVNMANVYMSDLSYNSYNNGLKNFCLPDRINLFEKIDRFHYRALGQRYPYTGVVNWKKSGVKDPFVVGRWSEGVLTFYDDVVAKANN